MNNITAEDLTNKGNSLYINGRRCDVLLDTGAEDNYVTFNLVQILNFTYKKYEKPLIRYTCLYEKFFINYYVEFKFSYKGIKYIENFNNLPKRKDTFIILGRKFSEKQITNATQIRNSKEIYCAENYEEKSVTEIIDKLCSEEGKIVKNYYCSFPIKSDAIVTDVPYKIAHAYEEGIDKEIIRLIAKGYISQSNSSWLNM